MRTLRHPAGPLIMTALLALGGCRQSDDIPEAPAPAAPDTTAAELPATMDFDTATARLLTRTDTLTLRVELAQRPDQRSFGLMDRDSLPADAGMVFLYEEARSPDASFYMYRTRIPLDIAFFDGAGRIVAILQMVPCRDSDPVRCQRYSPGVPHFGALEVNLGELSRSGVQLGDRIVIPGRVGS